MKLDINVNVISRTRLDKGYSQSELAQLAGVCYATVNYLENRRVIPRPGNLKRICDVLELKVSEVCTVRNDAL